MLTTITLFLLLFLSVVNTPAVFRDAYHGVDSTEATVKRMIWAASCAGVIIMLLTNRWN